MQLRRYYNNFKNEDNEQLLEAMLSMLSKIASKYYPVGNKNGYYCRSVAWVKDKHGKNHLLCTANTSNFHAEELLAKMIFELFNNDPTVIQKRSDGKFELKVHKMYIDIHPCDGTRYGKHCCEKFFNGKGKNVAVNDRIVMGVLFKADNCVYWNAPLPPTDVSGHIRTTDADQEQYLLGVDFNESAHYSQSWDSFHIYDDQGIHKVIDGNEFFSVELNRAKTSPEIEAMECQLFQLAMQGANDQMRHQFSHQTLSFLKTLLQDENQARLHYFATAIVKSWRLKQMLIAHMSIEQIEAIREIQLWLKPNESNQPDQNNNNAVPKIILHTKDKTLDSIIEQITLEEESDDDQDIKSESPPYAAQTKIFFDHLRHGSFNSVASFLSSIQNDPNYGNILLGKPRALLNPLNMILLNRNSSILRYYLSALRSAYENGVISKNEYSEIFTYKNKYNFTTIHGALYSPDPDNLLVLLCEFDDALKNGLITVDEYIQQLIHRNYLGLTPLLYMLQNCGAEVCMLYFQALETVLKHSKQQYHDILLSTSDAEFTALTTALPLSNPENIALYFRVLEDAVKEGIISEAEYVQLLIRPTKSQFTPLHEAILSNRSDNVALYFGALERALESGGLSYTQYAELLLKQNDFDTTALHFVLRMGQSENIYLYFKAIKKAMAKGEISKLQYFDLLVKPNKEGLTPLHQAILSTNPQSVSYYFDELKAALKEGLPLERYRNLLLHSTSLKYTPLTEAFLTGNFEFTKLYFAEIEGAVQSGLIKPEEYLELLIGANKSNFTLMHDVLKAGNIKNARLYFNKLQDALRSGLLKPEQYSNFLKTCSDSGCCALLQGLEYGQPETTKAYLCILEMALKDGFLTPEEYVGLLIKETETGRTPKEGALLSNNVESLTLYIDTLERAYQVHRCFSAQHLIKLMTTELALGFTTLLDALGKKVEMFEAYCRLLDWLKRVSPEEYAGLLVKRNHYGFSPLQQAFKAGTTQNIAKLLTLLDKAVMQKLIKPSEFAALYTRPNNAGFSLIHTAISKNVENLKLYFKYLIHLKTNGTIDSAKVLKLLTQQHPKRKMNPLHFAAKTGNIEVVKTFVAVLREILPDLANQTLKKLLQEKNSKGYCPSLFKSFDDAEEINKYLDDLRDELGLKRINLITQKVKKRTIDSATDGKDEMDDKSESNVSEHSLFKKQKTSANDGVFVNAILPLDKIYNSTKKLCCANLAENKIELMYEQGDDKRYRVYGGRMTIDRNIYKVYFIEAKEALTKYDFREFKPKEVGAFFFLNFKSERGEVLLPKHMRCFTAEQLVTLRGDGGYQFEGREVELKEGQRVVNKGSVS